MNNTKVQWVYFLLLTLWMTAFPVRAVTPVELPGNKTQPLLQAEDLKTGQRNEPVGQHQQLQEQIGKVIVSLPNKNFMSPHIKWYEAHWQGMDTMELDKELKQKLGYPMGLEGIFVIEVTLNAALSGMLAGDIVTAVEAVNVKDLKTFQRATREIKHKSHAAITVMRKEDSIQGKAVMKKMVFVLRDRLDLGFAQVEAAPMIVPGDIRPHPFRGPCTDCHAIGKGFQLAQDPDLITLPPPVISDASAKKKPPHEDRGQCHICHQINKAVKSVTETPVNPVNLN